MAVTLFRKRKVINNIIIRNGVKSNERTPKEKNDNIKSSLPNEINTKIRGRMYGRRTINR